MELGAIADKNLTHDSLFSSSLSLAIEVTTCLNPVGIIPLPLPSAKPFKGFSPR